MIYSSPASFSACFGRIKIDGSCNGLQHYATLGRDRLGAAAVNFVAGEKPDDVYSGIAARILDIMKRDAQRDPAEFPDAVRARVLVNQVDRKFVKWTVMTSKLVDEQYIFIIFIIGAETLLVPML